MSGNGGILLLTDGKAGHENQSRALVNALGGRAEIVKVAFKSPVHKALSYLFDRLGVKTESLFVLSGAEVSAGRFSAVVGTGSGTFYAVKTVARRLGVKCAVVLYPRGYDLGGFDCILAPSFDCPPARPNVVELPVNLVAADAGFYRRACEQFDLRHRQEKPAAAVVVGGPNKRSKMTAEWMRARLEKIFAENPGREIWVTTSRRTPPEVEAVVDSFPFGYKLLYSRDKFNPVPAFVSKAEKIYVSAESTGMISEACTFGNAQVEVMDDLVPGRHKFRRFIDSLARDGYVGGRRKVDLAPVFAAARSRLGLG